MLRAFEILDDRMKLSLLSLLLGVGLAAPMAYGFGPARASPPPRGSCLGRCRGLRAGHAGDDLVL